MRPGNTGGVYLVRRHEKALEALSGTVLSLSMAGLCPCQNPKKKKATKKKQREKLRWGTPGSKGGWTGKSIVKELEEYAGQ